MRGYATRLRASGWFWIALAFCSGVSQMACAEVTEFQHGAVRLMFDAGTGAWRGLALGDRQLLAGVDLPALDLGMDGAPWPAQAEWTVGDIRSDRDGADLVVTVPRTAGGWEVTETYRVRVDAPVLSRRAHIAWRGDAPVKVTRSTMRVPGVTLDAPDAEWAVPGNFPVSRGQVATAVPGRTTRERGWTGSDTGVAYVASAAAGVAVLVGFALDPSHASVWVEEGASSVSLVHHFETLALLRPDDELDVGTQWIRVADLTAETLADAAHALLGYSTPDPPADRPAWLAGAVIDELHPWGRLDAWDGGDRGDRMPSLEAQLPDLKALGVDACWLLPISEKPPWVYHLPTFRTIDPQVTTADQLRSFVAAGHRLGMRTLMDLVTYGIDPGSPDVSQLPPTVWCLDEKGERVRVWGGTVLAADCSDSDWQDYIVDLCSEWVRDMGCDGYRLDCGGAGQTPNWALRHGRQADTSMHWGGRTQNARIRQAIRGLNPDAILMPEAGATCQFASSDLLFDYPLYMVCRDATRMADTAHWVSALREWLAAQSLTHTPAQQAGLVRFLELHDTVAAQDYFGVGLSHALTALCSFLPGVVLLQQEQEIGFSGDLRAWLRLRHELPELSQGSVRFEGVDAGDPRVLAFARVAGDYVSVVLINLAPERVSCAVSWPTDLAPGGGPARDALTGEEFASGGVVGLAAYEPRVLRLRGAGLADSVPATAPVARAEGSLVLERAESALPDGSLRLVIHLAPMAGWFVQTGEGLLTDGFLDRHRATKPGETHVDATPPLARCWRPLERGLWDGLPSAAFGAYAPDGRAVVVRADDPGALLSARIEDNSARGESVELVLVAPKGGEMPIRVEEAASFRAVLAELDQDPTVSAGPWTVDPLWARLETPALGSGLSRRHGGVLRGLRLADGVEIPIRESDVYTDWGLFGDAGFVSLEGEPMPRLEVTAEAASFRGLLRTRSWNGVQTAYVAQPAVSVRLTYAPSPAGGLRCELGVTPSTDRPGTAAFLAYRLVFGGVRAWQVTSGLEIEDGVPGASTGQRIGLLEGPELEDASVTLDLGGHRLRIGGFGTEPGLPQRVFMTDGGPGEVALYLALLDGQPVTLAAGQERAMHFAVDVDP
jgi:glycosidase